MHYFYFYFDACKVRSEENILVDIFGFYLTQPSQWRTKEIQNSTTYNVYLHFIFKHTRQKKESVSYADHAILWPSR